MKDQSSPVKQWISAVLACWIPGCQAASPPEPPPEPDHLVADIAKVNAELLACMQRENDRLREERNELGAKIRAVREEASVLAGTPPRKPKRQP